MSGSLPTSVLWLVCEQTPAKPKLAVEDERLLESRGAGRRGTGRRASALYLSSICVNLADGCSVAISLRRQLPSKTLAPFEHLCSSNDNGFDASTTG